MSNFTAERIFCLEDVNESVPAYGNHEAYTVRYKELQYKIASYIQTTWPFQPKFKIYILGVMIL